MNLQTCASSSEASLPAHTEYRYKGWCSPKTFVYQLISTLLAQIFQNSLPSFENNVHVDQDQRAPDDLTLYPIEAPFDAFANRADPDQAALIRAA